MKVWFHGPALPRPTKVTIESLDWDVDDLKVALIAKAVLTGVGAPSLVVKRAVLVEGSSVIYEETGEELAAENFLRDFGDSFTSNAHFFVAPAPHGAPTPRGELTVSRYRAAAVCPHPLCFHNVAHVRTPECVPRFWHRSSGVS